MKGMIFAAGVGSRLKPWTDSHPKALVEVGGRPVICHVIDKFLKAGIDTIIINVHHFADQIVDTVPRLYPGVNLVFSDESDRLLDTGGGLRKALPLLGGEDVLIHNADIMTDFDLPVLVGRHRELGSDATLLVQDRPTSRYLLFDHGRLRGWTNVSTGQLKPPTLATADGFDRLAFGGVHVLSATAYGALAARAPEGEPFSITDFYVDSCGSLDFEAFVLPDGASWFDVGKPATLEEARHFISQ